ncbi:hypothetical protein SFRURICE_014865 [Spodoptera frugiperda]|nr:hypothetical protein SFRURICE_014865 [Spodoptera frugiperda]
METEAFNTELLIDEIEKRPAIWDMTSSDYSDKNLRRRAWEELVLIFCEGHDNEEKLGYTPYELTVGTVHINYTP